MPARRKPIARSPREIVRHADRVLKELRARAKADRKRGITTRIISRTELITNLSGETAHSPFLTSFGYGNAVRGATFVLDFAIMNPDPWPYSEDSLGLVAYWTPAGNIMELGDSILAADPVIGVQRLDIGVLNTSTTPYYLGASHLIPTTAVPGRNDLNYVLYTLDAFGVGVVLKRGSTGITIA
jgi:hypothetical protein